MMETVSQYIPVFTFISFFILILLNDLSGLRGVTKGLLLAMSIPWVVADVLTAGLLAIAGNVILGFFMPSCGISCLQSELLLAINRLGLLNKDKLKKEETI